MSPILVLRDAHARHHMRARPGAVAVAAVMLAAEIWLSLLAGCAGNTPDAVAMAIALPAALLGLFAAAAAGARLRQRLAARRGKYLSCIAVRIAADAAERRRAGAAAAGVARAAARFAGASARVVHIAELSRAAAQAAQLAVLGCALELTPRLLSQRPLLARAARA